MSHQLILSMKRIKQISETVTREFKCPKCNEQAFETITTKRSEQVLILP